MEVLKHGKTYKKIQCPNCNCEFTFSKKDVIFLSNGNAWLERPTTEIKWYVDGCPECGIRILVKTWKKGDPEDERDYR